jgi:ribonuclease P protein component
MRLRRCARLTNSASFRQVRQEGESYVNSLLVLCMLPNGRPYSRFGISVSRWVGKAAARNRIKRRLREAVRSLWHDVASGWDMVFVARVALRDQPFRAIVAAVRDALQRAGLLSAIATEAEDTARSNI